MKILVIEDNEQISAFLVRGLIAEGHAVDLKADGKSGFNAGLNSSWDVIVLDLLLPEMDGRDLCRELRMNSVATPILMLTALDSTEDVVRGLRLGADDYLTKPFAFDELLARLENISRRSDKAQQLDHMDRRLTVEDLVFDLDALTVVRAGQNIEMTAIEYSLLELLMRETGKVVSKQKILQNVWYQSEDPFTNVVEVYISRLRAKIDNLGDQKLIHTIRGRGYFLGLR